MGYCIGCPDIPSFVAAYGPGYVVPILDAPSSEVERPADVTSAREPWTTTTTTGGEQINGVAMAQQAYNPEWLLVEGNEDVLARGYAATMHIDLLEGWRAGGWGRKLIEQFAGSVRAARGRLGNDDGFRGIWIGIAAYNAQVIRFYEKVGFRQIESSPGGGPRMVMDL